MFKLIAYGMIARYISILTYIVSLILTLTDQITLGSIFVIISGLIGLSSIWFDVMFILKAIKSEN